MRRHDTDVTSLVFGLIFIGIVGMWALLQSDAISLPDLPIIGPAVLVAAGAVGLIATLTGSARGAADTQESQPAQQDSPAEPPLPL